MKRILFPTILLFACQAMLLSQTWLPATTLRKMYTQYDGTNAVVFSMYLKNISDSVLQYNGGQYHFDFNKAILNGGTGTLAIVSSGLPVAIQPKNPSIYTVSTPGQLRFATNTPPGAGNGFFMQRNDSILVMKVKLSTSAAALTNDSTAIKFRVAPMANPVVKFGAYINNNSTEIQSAATFFNDGEPGGVTPPTITWQSPLTVTDAGTGAATLAFGQAPGATNGLDTDLGEAALPAVPGTGTFDARFLLPNSTVASLKDYRSDTARLVIWTFSFQPSAAGYPIKLKWLPAALPAGGTVTLKSVPVEVPVNMRTDSMYTVSSSTVGSLRIEYNKDAVGINGGENVIPTVYALHQNYPNPFNPATTIQFDLPEDNTVSLAVYDVLGKQVASLINAEMKAGIHHISFSTKRVNLASGVYVYQLRAGKYSSVKKMILMR